METRVGMALLSVGLMLLAAGIAYGEGTFFPHQMMQRHQGYSFSLLANGAWWGNLTLISLALYIMGGYADQWNAKETTLALGAGLMTSAVLFLFVYLRGKFPDALAGGGEPISGAGSVVMIYSGMVYAAILLFYLRTDASSLDVLAVWFLLAVYIPLANHAVLAYVNGWYYFPWCPNIFAEESSPLRFIIGSEILLVVATFAKLRIAV